MYRRNLIKIYDKLFAAFGPQHWWPAESDFEVVVGAILTQSVSWKNVEKAIENLKAEGLLSVDGILKAERQKLADLVRSTRYYNQKAEKLKNICRHIKDNYDGDICKMFEKDLFEMRRELLSIKGLGRETADSIILYAARKPIFVVDAYTRRIFSRLGFLPEDADYQAMQDFFMQNLPEDVELFNEYHALIVRLGKDCCRNQNPLCAECPVSDACKFYSALTNNAVGADAGTGRENTGRNRKGEYKKST